MPIYVAASAFTTKVYLAFARAHQLRRHLPRNTGDNSLTEENKVVRRGMNPV